MSKKLIIYYLLLAEEGIAYYLTFKWSLLLFACTISLFATVVVCWSLEAVVKFEVAWEIVFLIVWYLVMIVLVIEFPIPEEIKAKIKQKIENTNKKKSR